MAAPFASSWDRFAKKRSWNFWILMAILALFGFAFYILFPFSWTDISTSERQALNGKAHGMTLGLDLKGGSHLVYQANLEGQEDRDGAMEGVMDIIQKRVNSMGVSEVNLQKLGDDRIIVQFPGITDINQAKDLIGQTAQLTFQEEGTTADGTQGWVDAKATGGDGTENVPLTGQYLKPTSRAAINQTTNEVVVEFEWNGEGATLFEQITGRNLGKPLAILLDGNIISSPTVQAKISDSGVITGLTLEEARTLAIQLNSGALPVPLGHWNADHSEFINGEPMSERTVSPTLGEEFVKRGSLALLVGMGIVMLFMIAYYRFPGVLASLALLVYVAVNLGIFKLVPVTLTLAGIGGFVLSIGMAVDANVLIFERTREELRAGKTLKAAIEAGFDRAWVAILHGNGTTLVSCLVLYIFGAKVVASDQVQGFAVTLAIGITTSMFSAIVVTRTFLRYFAGERMSKRRTWFAVEPKSS